MIKGIGIDSVELKRFEPWKHFCKKKLQRIFSPQEIEYAKKNPKKTVERFAGRFAAKEAFYKALSQCNSNSIPFLTLCKHLSVISNGPPQIFVNWTALNLDSYQKFNTHISITHTSTTATALVIIEEIKVIS